MDTATPANWIQDYIAMQIARSCDCALTRANRTDQWQCAIRNALDYQRDNALRTGDICAVWRPSQRGYALYKLAATTRGLYAHRFNRVQSNYNASSENLASRSPKLFRKEG